MNYATVIDFENAFGTAEAIDLTNLDSPTATEVNAVVLDGAIAAASAEIDSYLRAAGYALPLTEVPPALTGKCLDIARYKLDRTRTREEVRQRYLDAVYWLKDLAKGVASLGIEHTAGTGTVATALFYNNAPRVYTFDGLSDYGHAW